MSRQLPYNGTMAEGGANAVVLLHGFACLPRMWRPLLGLLPQWAERARCPLLPGHGKAPRLPREGDFMALAAQQRAAMVAPRYVLVGYSLGGRLALAMALCEPRRCAALVLISAGLGLADDGARAQRRRWDAQQADNIERLGLASFMHDWHRLPLFDSQRRLPAATLEEQHKQRLSHTPAGLAWAMRNLGLGNMPPLGARLAQLKMPLTMVTGSEDERYTAMAAQAAWDKPRIDHVTVAGAGHNVVLEAPQALATVLRDVVSTTATCSPTDRR